jgi:hypothetical protein
VRSSSRHVLVENHLLVVFDVCVRCDLSGTLGQGGGALEDIFTPDFQESIGCKSTCSSEPSCALEEFLELCRNISTIKHWSEHVLPMLLVHAYLWRRMLEKWSGNLRMRVFG